MFSLLPPPPRPSFHLVKIWEPRWRYDLQQELKKCIMGKKMYRISGSIYEQNVKTGMFGISSAVYTHRGCKVVRRMANQVIRILSTVTLRFTWKCNTGLTRIPGWECRDPIWPMTNNLQWRWPRDVMFDLETTSLLEEIYDKKNSNIPSNVWLLYNKIPQ